MAWFVSFQTLRLGGIPKCYMIFSSSFFEFCKLRGIMVVILKDFSRCPFFLNLGNFFMIIQLNVDIMRVRQFLTIILVSVELEVQLKLMP